MKTRFFLLMAFIVGLLAACSPAEATMEVEPPGETVTVKDATATTVVTESSAVTETGSSLTGSCANSYYPIQEGVTYSYIYSQTDKLNVEMLVSYSDVTENGYVSHLSIGDSFSADTEWVCTPEGLIADTYRNPNFAAAGYNLTTIAHTGVQIPLESEMVPEGSWGSQFDIDAIFDNEVGVGTADILVTESAIGVGYESVETRAGTFDNALRVEITGSVEIASFIDGESVGSVTLNGTTVSWYAPGIGLVKQENMSQGITTAIELLEIQK
jgi:hypothetical protein